MWRKRKEGRKEEEEESGGMEKDENCSALLKQ